MSLGTTTQGRLQQKLVAAIALIIFHTHHPQVLILDEPTLALGFLFSRGILDIRIKIASLHVLEYGRLGIP